jgi:hypothetical protein
MTDNNKLVMPVSTILHTAAVRNKCLMVLTVVTNNGKGNSTLVSEKKKTKKKKEKKIQRQ